MNFWYQPAIPRVRYSAGPLFRGSTIPQFRGSAIPQFHCTALSVAYAEGATGAMAPPVHLNQKNCVLLMSVTSLISQFSRQLTDVITITFQTHEVILT
jgi:hypothetical protein